MIVDEIPVVDFAIVETKDDAPVARDRHCPHATQFPLEPMKPKARKCHVPNFHSLVQASQYPLDFFHVSRREASMVVVIVEFFKAAVFKRRDH